jgi:hypothetical protein
MEYRAASGKRRIPHRYKLLESMGDLESQVFLSLQAGALLPNLQKDEQVGALFCMFRVNAVGSLT